MGVKIKDGGGPKKVRFSTLKAGDTFRTALGNIHMKFNRHASFNIIRLDTGILDHINDDECVEPVEIEATVIRSAPTEDC